MNNIERFTTLKLEFSRVAWYLGNILSALLGREIHCTAKAEDDSYWSIAAIDDRFTNSEIVSLIQYVGGDATMIRRCIPPDSNSSRSLGMDLCEALLKHVLKMDWKREFVTEDALWILGTAGLAIRGTSKVSPKTEMSVEDAESRIGLIMWCRR